MTRTSLELRWFFKGMAPAGVLTWFDTLAPADRPHQEKTHTDLYFLVTDREDLGLKLSRGRLELKCRRQSEPFSLSRPRVSGFQEIWVKELWRGANELIGSFEQAFTQPKLPGWRIEVQKRRALHKYWVDAAGDLHIRAPGEPADRLFKLELTSLIKNERPWWTLCLEMSGGPENLAALFAAAVQKVLQENPQLSLEASRSGGYPHWLMRTG